MIFVLADLTLLLTSSKQRSSILHSQFCKLLHHPLSDLGHLTSQGLEVHELPLAMWQPIRCPCQLQQSIQWPRLSAVSCPMFRCCRQNSPNKPLLDLLMLQAVTQHKCCYSGFNVNSLWHRFYHMNQFFRNNVSANVHS